MNLMKTIVSSAKNCNDQHLYITSDDEIKEGDWYYDTNHNAIGKYDSSAQIGKKIVATTDKSIMHLSNNGRVGYPLPNIPESFIQDYIKAYNEGNPIETIFNPVFGL